MQQVVRLDAAGLVPVPQAQHLVGAHGGADGQQHVGVHGRLPAAHDDRVGERLDAVPQPGRQHLPHDGEGALGSLPEVAAGGRGRAEGDDEGHGLLVVEQQRRQVLPGGEPVPAVRSLQGRDGVAELAQPVDVAAHGAGADAEPVGEEEGRASRAAPAAGTAGSASGLRFRSRIQDDPRRGQD